MRSMIEGYARFWEEMAWVYNSKPDWHLPNRKVFENCSMSLRLFHEGTGVPILIVPPNAGHHSSIVETLMETCMAVTPTSPLYSLDWQPAQACNASKDDSLSSLYEYLAHSVEIAGPPVHLIGLCQGGWLSAIYAALHPANVKTLILAAAPVDFHAAVNESKLQQYLDVLPQAWYTGMVDLGGGVWPGELQLAGFRNMNPYDRYVGDYVQLWNAILDDNEKAILKWRRDHIWYDNPLNLGGVWFLEAMEQLFRQNRLVKKQLEISGKIVDLSKITCPVYLLAGGNDDITLREEMFNLGKYVSSGKVKKYVIPDCGHIGVFVRANSQKYWRKILEEACADPMEALADKLKL